MTIKSVALALVVAAGSSGAAFAQQIEPGRTLQAVGRDEVLDAAAALGWSMSDMSGDDEELFVLLRTDGGFEIAIEGLQCPSGGCTEWRIVSSFDGGDPEQAQALADQVDGIWAHAFAEGDRVVLSRMDFSYGGVTEGHLRTTLSVFDDVMADAQAIITACRSGEC